MGDIAIIICSTLYKGIFINISCRFSCCISYRSFQFFSINIYPSGIYLSNSYTMICNSICNSTYLWEINYWGSTGSATSGVGVGCTGLSGKVKSTLPNLGILITEYPPHLLSFVSKDTFKVFPANSVSPSP